ncbi:glutathione S-transferase family protein [Hyphomonas jannaschiana]|uniref:Glutathione S-transferase domain-containing protein n=1 Tax=Hyphomonas jannaschiana VP2 TaxID=1280952 RepID=A0A059FEL6_9PROT|nr:glutathione S-transferase family protein [Hyphomonas jannaschiana]KCZ88968.1 glutathione S-transferase domain-containing protein [Hyphomonas jannaschiana VP2]
MPTREITRLTLYGDSISGNCQKPKWTADLLGIPFDWVEVDILKGGTQTEDFLAVNPVGQVPVARWPDGRTLAQSNAIMLYLAEEAGSDLIPEDSFRRAQMMSWLFWEQYSHETAIAVRRFHKHYLKKSEDEIDPNLMAKGRRALGVMEMQLTFTDWIVGDQMTLADIALVAYTRLAHEGGFDLTEFPAVERWVSRTEAALGIPHAREVAA